MTGYQLHRELFYIFNSITEKKIFDSYKDKVDTSLFYVPIVIASLGFIFSNLLSDFSTRVLYMMIFSCYFIVSADRFEKDLRSSISKTNPFFSEKDCLELSKSFMNIITRKYIKLIIFQEKVHKNYLLSEKTIDKLLELTNAKIENFEKSIFSYSLPHMAFLGFSSSVLATFFLEHIILRLIIISLILFFFVYQYYRALKPSELILLRDFKESLIHLKNTTNINSDDLKIS